MASMYFPQQVCMILVPCLLRVAAGTVRLLAPNSKCRIEFHHLLAKIVRGGTPWFDRVHRCHLGVDDWIATDFKYLEAVGVYPDPLLKCSHHRVIR